jgi:hypothetical protein
MISESVLVIGLIRRVGHFELAEMFASFFSLCVSSVAIANHHQNIL